MLNAASSIAIVGAGDLGGALAHKLAGLECAGRIVLIDEERGIAAGKALDIQQAGSIEGFDVRLEATADLTAAAGAAAVVFADEARPDPARPADECLARLARLATLDRNAVFVCAGASHVELMERAVGERRIPRARIVGAAPLAFEAAVRALVAAATDRSPAQIALAVAGRPPEFVILWSGATIEGSPIEQAVGPAVLAGIRRRVPALWPPGPNALASAAARAAAAVATGSRRLLLCSVGLDHPPAARGRVATMPVELGPQGIIRIVPPVTSARERMLVENAIAGTWERDRSDR